MKKLLIIGATIGAACTSADADGTTTLQFTSSTYERILRYEVPSDDAEGASEAITDSEDYIDTEGDQQFLYRRSRHGEAEGSGRGRLRPLCLGLPPV